MSQDVQTAEDEKEQTPLFYFLQIAYCLMQRLQTLSLIFNNLFEHIDRPCN